MKLDAGVGGELLGILQDLRVCADDPASPPANGICGEEALRWVYADNYTIYRGMRIRGLIRDLVVDWPEYSGDLVYPVPHMSLSPMDAYQRCMLDGSLWDKSTAYGQARRRLLDWLIEQLKSDSTLRHGGAKGWEAHMACIAGTYGLTYTPPPNQP